MSSKPSIFKYPWHRFILILLGVLLFALWVNSFSVIGIGWDELWDFYGVDGSFQTAIAFFRGESPPPFMFDLKWFGNATRWPTYLTWLSLVQLPWRDLPGINPDAFVIASGYIKLNHLNASVFGILGIILTGLWAYWLRSAAASVLSVFLLGLLPTWLGHSWMNSKDVPFATAYLLYSMGTSLLISCHSSSSTLATSRLQKINQFLILRILGIALMLGSRISSVLFILLAELLYFLVFRRRQWIIQSITSLSLGFLGAFILTPQAWSSPLIYPLDAISFISSRQVASDGPVAVASYLISNFLDLAPASIFLTLVLGTLVLIKLRPRIFASSGFLEFRRICLSCGGKVRPFLLSLALVMLLSWQVVELFLLSPYQYTYRSEISRIESLLLGRNYGWRSDYWGLSNLEAIRSCMADQVCSGSLQKHSIVVADAYNQDLLRSLASLLHPSLNKSREWSPQLGRLGFSTQASTGPDCKEHVSISRPFLFPVPGKTVYSRIIQCPRAMGVG